MTILQSTNKHSVAGLKLVAMVIVLLVTGGCAANRWVLDTNVEPHGNPTSGKAVQIMRVTDRRMFEADPDDPSTPSLKGGEIDNTAITSRAIARKRGGFGNAWGDILLPEGHTVAHLMEEALTRAFQDAGYRVVGKNDAQTNGAIPVEADIEKFWTWMTPGFWALTLECKTRVQVKAAIAPFQAGEYVEGYARESAQIAPAGTWMETVNKGLDDFVRNLRDRLVVGRLNEATTH